MGPAMLRRRKSNFMFSSLTALTILSVSGKPPAGGVVRDLYAAGQQEQVPPRAPHPPPPCASLHGLTAGLTGIFSPPQRTLSTSVPSSEVASLTRSASWARQVIESHEEANGAWTGKVRQSARAAELLCPTAGRKAVTSMRSSFGACAPEAIRPHVARTSGTRRTSRRVAAHRVEHRVAIPSRPW